MAEDVKQVEAKSTNQTMAQIRSFAAGGAGGVCAVVIGHPFDLVKVRLQTAEAGIYSGAMDVVRRTVAKEGLRVGDGFNCYGGRADHSRGCMLVFPLLWSE